MLLTEERINALSRINRFAGWTCRPYSVLEHSLIGAKLLDEDGYAQHWKRAFMLHDLHETAFGGDITTPVKTKYMSAQYHADVQLWDTELSVETGVPPCTEIVKWMDKLTLAAETRTVFTGNWTAPMSGVDRTTVSRAMAMIDHGLFSGDDAVKSFWTMWFDA
jgi:hypothetical protein